MKKLFFIIFLGILSVGFVCANNCYRNSRCFHFGKNRQVYYNGQYYNQDRRVQKRPPRDGRGRRDGRRRDGRGCPENGRGYGRHKGPCQNPDKGPGYGQGGGRGRGQFRSDN